eukprot:m.398864 g.398864  ORF g.398864 m.398864 type:complete len:151 (+) comp16778_c0_seq44:5850-6302(+)
MLSKKWENGNPMYKIEAGKFDSFQPLFAALKSRLKARNDDYRRIRSSPDTPQSNKLRKEIQDDLTKVAKKLFKPKDDIATVVKQLHQDSVNKLKEDHQCKKDNVEIWKLLVALAKRAWDREGGVFGNYTVDDPDHHHVLNVLSGLAKFRP